MDSPKLHPTDELVALIDSKNEHWDLYRNADKEWVIQLESASQKKVFNADKLSQLLEVASVWDHVHNVPSQPKELYLSEFSAKRDGSKWSLCYQCQGYTYNLKTKKAAMELAENLVIASQRRIQEWQEKYGGSGDCK